MKTLAIVPLLLLSAACASTDTKIAAQDENYKLCANHKSDYQHFQAKFQKEHDQSCGNGCVYSASMNKYSDTAERIAGVYYLMNCDSTHGRI